MLIVFISNTLVLISYKLRLFINIYKCLKLMKVYPPSYRRSTLNSCNLSLCIINKYSKLQLKIEFNINFFCNI